MDLNYLLYHHQILLVRAADADVDEEREAATIKADRVGSLIEHYRDVRMDGPRVPIPAVPAH